MKMLCRASQFIGIRQSSQGRGGHEKRGSFQFAGRCQWPSGSLDRTRHSGKCVVRIRADQSNSSNDQHKDYGQHDRVFRDILPVIFDP